MTSIKNYESVELPETPVKEKKGIFDFAKNYKTYLDSSVVNN